MSEYTGTWVKLRGEWVIKITKQSDLARPEEFDTIAVTKKDGSISPEICSFVISETPYAWLVKHMNEWDRKNYDRQDGFYDDMAWIME